MDVRVGLGSESTGCGVRDQFVGTFTIGRDETNDIVIDDTSVSRQHARVEDLGRGRVLIVDLHSANGCFVEHDDNWRQFGEAEVTASENLLLGDHQTTARELIQRIAKPRQPGATVMAEAEETQRGFQGNDRNIEEYNNVGGRSLAWWKLRPEYQKIAAIAAAAVLGLLIVGAATIGLLKGAY